MCLILALLIVPGSENESAGWCQDSSTLQTKHTHHTIASRTGNRLFQILFQIVRFRVICWVPGLENAFNSMIIGTDSEHHYEWVCSIPSSKYTLNCFSSYFALQLYPLFIVWIATLAPHLFLLPLLPLSTILLQFSHPCPMKRVFFNFLHSATQATSYNTKQRYTWYYWRFQHPQTHHHCNLPFFSIEYTNSYF